MPTSNKETGTQQTLNNNSTITEESVRALLVKVISRLGRLSRQKNCKNDPESIQEIKKGLAIFRAMQVDKNNFLKLMPRLEKAKLLIDGFEEKFPREKKLIAFEEDGNGSPLEKEVPVKEGDGHYVSVAQSIENQKELERLQRKLGYKLANPFRKAEAKIGSTLSDIDRAEVISLINEFNKKCKSTSSILVTIMYQQQRLEPDDSALQKFYRTDWFKEIILNNRVDENMSQELSKRSWLIDWMIEFNKQLTNLNLDRKQILEILNAEKNRAAKENVPLPQNAGRKRRGLTGYTRPF